MSKYLKKFTDLLEKSVRNWSGMAPCASWYKIARCSSMSYPHGHYASLCLGSIHMLEPNLLQEVSAVWYFLLIQHVITEHIETLAPNLFDQSIHSVIHLCGKQC